MDDNTDSKQDAAVVNPAAKYINAINVAGMAYGAVVRSVSLGRGNEEHEDMDAVIRKSLDRIACGALGDSEPQNLRDLVVCLGSLVVAANSAGVSAKEEDYDVPSLVDRAVRYLLRSTSQFASANLTASIERRKSAMYEKVLMALVDRGVDVDSVLGSIIDRHVADACSMGIEARAALIDQLGNSYAESYMESVRRGDDAPAIKDPIFIEPES